MTKINRKGKFSQKTSVEIFIPEYMKNFRCIGPDCEDTCCKIWQILIDKSNFKKLKKTMSSTHEKRELFRNSIKKNKSSSKSDLNYASIQLDKDDQYCPFFTKEKLCSIHKDYGEAFLSRTCRTYPRRPIYAKDRWEITGALSCPEIARACLLHDESTRETSIQETKKVLETLAKDYICDESNNPYVFYVHDIRSIFDQLLNLEGYPFASRLFFVAFLTNRITPFFKKTQHFSEDQLAVQIQEVADEVTIHKLHEGFQTLEAKANLPLKIINSLVQAKLSSYYVQALLNMINKSYTDMSSQGVGINPTNLEEEKNSSLYSQYKNRYDKLISTFGIRLESVLVNFARNQNFSFPYIQNESVYTATQTLMLKLCMVNFFIVSHNDLTPFLKNDHAPDEKKTEAGLVFDRVAVEVVYSFSRALEHDLQLWEKLHKITEESNIEGLALLTQFIQFSFAK